MVITKLLISLLFGAAPLILALPYLRASFSKRTMSPNIDSPSSFFELSEFVQSKNMQVYSQLYAVCLSIIILSIYVAVCLNSTTEQTAKHVFESC